MANNPLYNRVKMSVSGTPGTGSITLGSAAATYASFAEIVGDGNVVSYLITQDGAAEIGKGTYTASGTILSRDELFWSSTGSKINVSSSAFVFLTALAEDIVQYASNGKVGIGTSSPTEMLHVWGNALINGQGLVTGLTVQLGSDLGKYIAVQFGENTGPTITVGDYDLTITTQDGSNERVRVASDGNVGIGTNAPTALLDVNSDKVRLRTSKTPSSATATGNAGDICWDSSYVYVCVATDTWKRAALSTW